MAFFNRYLVFAALLSVVSLTEVGALKTSGLPYLRQADLSKYASNDGQWMSVSEDVQFMPNDKLPPLPKSSKRRNLETEEGEESTTGAWEEYDPYSVQPFVEVR